MIIMAIKVSAWNLQEGLALPGRSDSLVESALGQDADVMILSDAYWLGNPLHGADAGIAEEAIERFRSEGYQDFRAEYGDRDKWEERYLVALSRLAVSSVDTVRLGGRKAVSMTVGEAEDKGGLQVLGAHFNDENELLRMGQAYDAVQHLEGSGPSAIIGDFNALHGADGISRIMASPVVDNLIGRIPHKRCKNIGERVHQMAWGSTFRLLEAAGFRDADPGHTASFPSKFPVLHLDRCFVSPEAAGRDFAVMPHNPSSDHRAIEVTIET